ncbi:MAG: tetratricopeptide repeat protein [Bacteroidetes bacterium]|nr:tetratricopeptide repeat protein [Bacteroidota bacterium]
MALTLESLRRRLSKVKSASKRISALIELGEFHLPLDPVRALEYGKSAVQLIQESKDYSFKLSALSIIAKSQYLLSDHEASVATYEIICDTYRTLNDRCGLAVALSEMSQPLKSLGEYRKAIECLEISLANQQEDKPSSHLARTYHYLGSIYQLLADNIRAKDFNITALRLLETLPDKLLEAEVYSSLGWIYSDLQEFHSATEAHTIDLDISTELGNLQRQAAALGNLGQLYGRQNELDTSLEYFERSLNIQIQMGHSNYQALTHANIANIFAMQGKTDEALSQIEISVELATTSNDYYTKGMVLFAKGSHLVNVKRYEEGVDCLLQVQQMLENGMQNKERCTLLYALSVGYEGIGDIPEALKYFKLLDAAKESLFAEKLKHERQIADTKMALQMASTDKQYYQRKSESLEAKNSIQAHKLLVFDDQLAEMNRYLQEIIPHIEALTHSSDTVDLQKSVQAIVRKIKKNLSNHHARYRDKKSLEMLDTTFQQKLRRAYPLLSDTEEKICGLVRLNLGSEQIADLLFCSKRTVDWHRSNIRKKMRIPNDTELHAYLESFFASKNPVSLS